MRDNSDGTTVVLGWDGLDYQLLNEYGLLDSFCEYTTPIETYRNEHIGEPHTREIWPTMITGVSPDEHGIWAAKEGEGVKWRHPGIRAASKVAQYTIPEDAKAAIGRWLRSQGAQVEKYESDYYHNQGLETVFDGRRSLPIAVPNYRTELDDENDFMFDRGAELGEWLDRDVEGWQPADVSQQARVERKMWSEAGRKLALVEHAIQRQYDLVWVWFGIVDTCGHVEPAASTPVQRRAYEQAAEWTEQIRGQLKSTDCLVCVSDHGLRDGHHTMDATLSTDEKTIANRVDSVYDVRTAIDMVTPSQDPVEIPPLGDEYKTNRKSSDATADEVRARLEDLGYV